MTTRLPASLQSAWGLRPPAVKGPKPLLGLALIVDAAIRVASTEGLAAVSMSRTASELGAATMALYRHVGSKDELLAQMVDRAYGSPPPAAPDTDWRAALTFWASAILAAMRRHPWMLRVPVGGPPTMPNGVAWFERGLSALRHTKLREKEKVGVLMLVNGFVRNEALLAADLARAADLAGTTPGGAGSSYGALLSTLIDPRQYPAIDALLTAGVFEQPDADPDADFTFGLERILDGIDTLVRTRRANQR